MTQDYLAFPRLFGARSVTIDVTVWHKHNSFLPVRLTDGARLNPSGQIWRRFHLGEWEYKQDPETLDDYEARQF
ncbi:hypothetical protein RLEG12_32055 [Rhizobium leguminosarum bv. trifolii CB782]|uniref:Uncharacterized protein n=1 Tax=Rhizobium hidalgonense TaxID=1538159 RepID=A0A2A6KB62_9HYPH|nr:hypothetical protein [Rhizobium hidalgonense]AHG47616.1 hypothetical protein RLEG12_32055 [Rhizobium leguminosarum bv. trifolii CB782]EJC74775.1 hypothetical protein Rleg10DRAFT_3271 [Rhizobium leguminosarum bv. trifolii WSM2012]MDR9775759.1 hypothetical protein [Rhizobium hidalgonense]MDR9804313.1 hypothetical protein [Rhizobium hidalgonense]MDR9813708.1 hypothetical protein [Rhizobium hidalgonense]